MSLKIRIDLLFGLLLFLGLAGNIGHMLVGARTRVQAESEAMTRVTRDFVEAALLNLHSSADPEDSLRQLTKSLDQLRHVRVTFVRRFDGAGPAFFAPDTTRREAPAWFFNLIHTRDNISVLPVFIDDKKFGDVVIASDPADEVNEVWQDVRNLAFTGGAIVLAALLGASFLLGRTLKPLERSAAALGRLRDGDYQARVEAAGSPEFVDLCAKINALAEALQNLSRANHDLIRQMMEVQESERKRIARELHDEIGPHLFALRANATVIEAGLKDSGKDNLLRCVVSIRDQIEALQGQNRRILRQLRPPALDELGLAEALKILIDGWREADPKVNVQLRLPEAPIIANAKQSLALYRLVQEALTNIFRHAHATRVAVDLSIASAPPEIRLRVQDDGVGVDAARPAGLGISGMRERVRSLDGRFAFGAALGGGSLLEVALPLARPKDEISIPST